MPAPPLGSPDAPQDAQPLTPIRPQPTGRRWLLFVHQLPSHPSNLRVRTWRRLQQLGAIPVKQAVYALPDTADAREDFEWLKTEVKASGGDASVFAADSVDPWSDDALVDEFRRSRQDAYTNLARDIEKALKRLGASRRPRGTRAPAVRRLLDTFRERLTALEGIDFFGSAGRDRVIAVLAQFEGRASEATEPKGPASSGASAGSTSYQARLWVTRPRPGVDRMASAWLIRRFIDAKARFGFAADRQGVPEHAVAFDMFGGEFSHQGESCTFETLCTVFGLGEPAVARIAAIVHDLDFKESHFGASETATVGAMIDGLQLAYADDDALLAQGMTLFDSLYRSFERSLRSAGPRPLAAPRRREAQTPKPHKRKNK